MANTANANVANDVNKVFFEGNRSPQVPIPLDRDTFFQLIKRARREQLALRDDCDIATQPLNDLQHMGREKYCQSTFCKSREQILQRAGGDRVHAFKGLIEEQDFRAMDQRARE